MSPVVVDRGVCDIAPNEAAYGFDTATALAYNPGSAGNQYRGLANLFDGGWETQTSAGWLLSSSGKGRPSYSDDTTWIPIVMRVADGTPRITSFDLVAPSGVADGTEVAAWRLEASADGFNSAGLGTVKSISIIHSPKQPVKQHRFLAWNFTSESMARSL